VSKIFPPTDEAIARAAEHLTRGELIGMPTETVYGIAANAMNPGAVAKIFAAKGRPSTNPLIVHLSDASDLGKVISDRIERSILDQIAKLSPYWPGPLTLVLPRSKEVPDIVTAGHSTVAVRVPENEIARKLIRQCGFPLAAPSANRSKYVGPTQLRPGIITQEDLTDRLQVEVRDVPTVNSESTDLIAPGMMHQHYSPRTPSRLVTANLFTASDAASMPPRCGRIAFEPLPTEITTKYAVVEILSSTGNLAEVARKLFASLRKMDDSDLEMIHIDRCPEHGLVLAIMDRLRRATASERP
jgi:L-threonylcarbamoyladenylate synthase